jgi:hypothetical protein
MKQVLITLAIALTAITSQAQSRFINEGAEDILYREGVASYSDNNGLVATSWFTMRSKVDGQSGKWLMQVHCDSRMIRTIRYIGYRNGEVIRNESENWSAQWRNPVPGSFESLFQQACHTR